MFRKDDQDAGSKQYSGLLPLQVGTDAVLQHLSVKNHTDSQFIIAIAKNWQYIVPNQYNKYCYPVKLHQDSAKNYVLHIKITNQTVSIFLENAKVKIIERINLIFGYHAIAEIKLLS